MIQQISTTEAGKTEENVSLKQTMKYLDTIYLSWIMNKCPTELYNAPKSLKGYSGCIYHKMHKSNTIPHFQCVFRCLEGKKIIMPHIHPHTHFSQTSLQGGSSGWLLFASVRMFYNHSLRTCIFTDDLMCPPLYLHFVLLPQLSPLWRALSHLDTPPPCSKTLHELALSRGHRLRNSRKTARTGI